MTTLAPRQPYSEEELRRLYPPNLKLQLVQIVCSYLIFLNFPLLVKMSEVDWCTRTRQWHRKISEINATRSSVAPTSWYRSRPRLQGSEALLSPSIGERSPVSARFQNVSGEDAP